MLQYLIHLVSKVRKFMHKPKRASVLLISVFPNKQSSFHSIFLQLTSIETVHLFSHFSPSNGSNWVKTTTFHLRSCSFFTFAQSPEYLRQGVRRTTTELHDLSHTAPSITQSHQPSTSHSEPRLTAHLISPHNMFISRTF